MESRFLIEIKTIENVKKFVAIANKFKDPVDVKQGRYVVDGKSIMALFSLDVSKPMWVEIKSKNPNIIIKFYDEMEEFTIESSEPERRGSAISEWFRNLKTY